MGKFNTYRYLVLKDVDSTGYGGKKYQRKQKPPPRLRRVFLLTSLVSIIIFLSFYTSVLFPMMDRVADSLGYTEPIYAVIIDAGSTGSRVLAYSFHKSFVGGQLVLDSELFYEVKPGLSSYVDDPQKGAQSILDLVSHAYPEIPERYRSSTPLLLRATAGLRLLKAGSAERLLDTTRAALSRTGFRLSADAVEIMDGRDEGINSWFTVNFLKRKLNTLTHAALDLGGGSTQITYEPRGKGTNLPLVTLPGPQRNVSLFTYSFLNLGLMAARRGAFLVQNGEEATHVESDCINPIIRDHPWRYSNVDYFVSGAQSDSNFLDVKETQLSVSERVPIVKLEKCRSLLEKMTRKLLQNTPIPTGLVIQEINAFSYYYDRATEAGLIDPVTGGKVKVESFAQASERECSSPNVDQPFACLDLTFISILLQEAFSLDKNKEVELIKKIDGHEISWALGLAYNTLIRDL